MFISALNLNFVTKVDIRHAFSLNLWPNLNIYQKIQNANVLFANFILNVARNTRKK